MVKTGGPVDWELKWNNLTKEQVKSIVSDIGSEITKVVEDIESRLQILSDKSSTDDWYILVAQIGKRLHQVIECFPSYSAESYEALKYMQYKSIVQELKQYSKKKVCLEQYFKLKMEISSLVKQIAELKETKKQRQECKRLIDMYQSQITANCSLIRSIQDSFRRVSNEIDSNKKTMEREIAELKSEKANAMKRLYDLRATAQQKSALLLESVERKEREKEALKREQQINIELMRVLAQQTRAQKVLQAEINCRANNGGIPPQ